ncbi:hypothetical protein [Ruminococcus bromii]|uniref:hypothetical protein n=1 Tax=Ruminococcus bromii TaxID=40518 RepID=UPI00241D2121|nr:hypothetical protein [Ruminococcus bromii]
MKEKSGVKLADSIREMINTKISEKPVKSRIFEDFEGIKNAPPRLLLSERSGVRIPFGTPKTPPENPAKGRLT